MGKIGRIFASALEQIGAVAGFAPYASSPTPLLGEGRRRRDGAKGAYGPKKYFEVEII